MLKYEDQALVVSLFPGTGVRDVFVQIGTGQLARLGVSSLKDYEFEGIAISSVPGPINSVVVQSWETGSGIVCRITADTRHIDLPETAAETRWMVRLRLVPKKASQAGAPPPAQPIASPSENADAPRPKPPIPPVQFELLEFRCKWPKRYIPAGLVLDLGNTRSFAVLVDDLRGPSGTPGLKGCGLDLLPHVQRPNIDDVEQVGVFDSFLVLESPHRFANEVKPKTSENFGEHLAFVRMGSVVDEIGRELAGDTDNPGRFSLSSPKRYFWQEDAEEAGWKMYDPGGKNVGSRSRSLDVALAEKLCSQNGGAAFTAPFLARSLMLSATFVELLEQAEQVINSPEFQAKSLLKEPRRLECVYVTYPTAWSGAERDLYKQKLEAGLEAFCALRALPKPKLDVSCDEASAVLLSYVFFEIIKLGGIGENWIRLVGRRTATGAGGIHAAVRLGVIDIGGGTSDLVIADVMDFQEGPGSDLQLARCYQDGVDIAGDELLRQVTQEITLPALGRLLCREPGKGQLRKVFAEVLDEGNDYDQIAQRAKWARNLWFPISIEIVQAITKTEGKNGAVTIDLGKFSNSLNDFCSAVFAEADRRQLDEFYDRPDVFRLEMPDDAVDQLKSICSRIFAPTARQFGAAIIGFGCDLVLVAGKTSEIPYLLDVFRDQIPLPWDKFVPLKDYHIGNRFDCPLARNYRIADAKVTTVLGAAIYMLASEKSSALGAGFQIDPGAAPGIRVEDHYWGVVTAYSRRFSDADALWGPHKPSTTARLPLNAANSIFLARRRFSIPQQDAHVAFELRIRPEVLDQHGPAGQNAEVEICRTAGLNGARELEISTVSGQFQDGTKLEPEQLELRHRIMLEDSFWVDSGKILSDTWLNG